MALISAVRNRVLPARGAATNQTSRVDDYGNLLVNPGLLEWDTQGIEGSRYVALPTPAAGGTGTAMSIQTSYSDTAGVTMVISNSSTSNSRDLVLDYIRGRCTAAGSSSTSAEVAFETDTTDRYASGVTTTLTNYKVYPSATGTASSATVRLGGITAAAASANRSFLGHQLIRKAASPCWIVEDTVLFSFGSVGTQVPANVAGPLATTQIATSFAFGPAVVPAGGSFLMHIVNVANASTAPSFVWEVGWLER